MPKEGVVKKYLKNPASVVILDIRNFTNNFIEFQKNSDDSFIEFVESIWQAGTDIAKIVSDNFHINSTGDGFVLVYFNENHEKTAYITGLVLNNKINSLCRDFAEYHNISISFGVGIETGLVQEIVNKENEKKTKTYLGNVINKAARIESETKSHARANVIIGDQINRKLVKDLFDEDYLKIMNEVKENFLDQELVLSNINKMNEMNQEMLLSYIFEHNLKGVSTPTPLFRVSPTLSNPANSNFKTIIMKLSSLTIYDKITKYLEE